MNKNTALIALGAFGLVLVASSSKVSKRFIVPITDNMKLRPCGNGCGHWGASRGNRKHWGVDIVVKESGNVYAPITGRISRYPFPYPGDLSYKGIEIIGEGEHEGLKVKIFYCVATISRNAKVKKGQKIAIAQDISKKYKKGMVNHLHVEFYRDNQRFDPTKLMQL